MVQFVDPAPASIAKVPTEPAEIVPTEPEKQPDQAPEKQEVETPQEPKGSDVDGKPDLAVPVISSAQKAREAQGKKKNPS